MIQFITHFSLHLVAPIAIAYIFFKPNWKTAALIMLATVLVDLDHLLATPIFDPNRCSIDFHPLHSYYAIAIYLLLVFPRRTRVIAVGLLLHMFADQVDCWMM